MAENGMSPADIAAVTRPNLEYGPGFGAYGNYGFGGFGGLGGDLVWIVLLFALFGMGGGGSGAKWEVDSIVKLVDINFEKAGFTKFDYAYVVNMLYSDYCHIFTDSDYYLKMAKAFLTDEDYPGTPGERAYKNAIKRICYFEHKK